jgi:hypothetical protein
MHALIVTQVVGYREIQGFHCSIGKNEGRLYAGDKRLTSFKNIFPERQKVIMLPGQTKH